MADEFRFSPDLPQPPGPGANRPNVPEPVRSPPIAPPPDRDGRFSPTDPQGDAYDLADEPVEAQIVEPDLVAAEAVEVAGPLASTEQPWSIDTRRNALDHRAREKPRRKWPWIAALVIGIPVGGIAVLGLIGWLFVASAKEMPITEQDRNVVLKAEDVAEFYPILEVRPSAATIKKVRYLDGTHDVEYEYESTNGKAQLSMYCSVTVEKNAGDALTSYAALDAVTQIGLSVAGDVKVRKRDDLFRWGDASSHSLIENQSGVVGNIFSTRSGKYIFVVTIVGIYFDDADSLSRLLTPRLERLKTYKP